MHTKPEYLNSEMDSKPWAIILISHNIESSFYSTKTNSMDLFCQTSCINLRSKQTLTRSFRRFWSTSFSTSFAWSWVRGNQNFQPNQSLHNTAFSIKFQHPKDYYDNNTLEFNFLLSSSNSAFLLCRPFSCDTKSLTSFCIIVQEKRNNLN